MRSLAPYYSFLVPALVTRYPWLIALDESDLNTFARAYLTALARAQATRDSQPLRSLLFQWEYTASLHADPTLLASLLAPIIEDAVTGTPALMPPPTLD